MRDSKLSQLREKNSQLGYQEAYESAREYALRLLDMRDYSSFQILERMVGRGYDQRVCQDVCNRLSEVGLLDDQRYANMLVRDRFDMRGLARRALRLELLKRGIDGIMAEQALDQISEQDERETGVLWAAKKARSCEGQKRDVVFRRVVSMLGRKGYSAGVAVSITNQVLDELEQ